MIMRVGLEQIRLKRVMIDLIFLATHSQPPLGTKQEMIAVLLSLVFLRYLAAVPPP